MVKRLEHSLADISLSSETASLGNIQSNRRLVYLVVKMR